MFPMVITIFSAPNYCDVYNNTASILVIKVIIDQFRIVYLTSSNLSILRILTSFLILWIYSPGPYLLFLKK